MSAPRPPDRYDPRWAAELKRDIDRNAQQAHKKGQDIEVGPARLILTAPNGTRYSVTVSNAGTLTATAI